jgi:FkbM family methyltransferase
MNIIFVCFVFALILWTIWCTAGKAFPLETIPRYFRKLENGDPEFYNERGERINTHVREWIEQRDAEQYIRPTDVVLELGARYGTVTSVINRKLQNKSFHVAVEPDSRVIDALRSNLARSSRSNDHAIIFEGVVSKNALSLENHDFWGGYGVNSTRTNGNQRKLRNATVQELEAHVGKQFSALVADCEGCLGSVLEENPTLYDSLNVLLFEADGKCDY